MYYTAFAAVERIFMKTLYLHIGCPKTATSSIQKFLKINRKVLQKHGYCFPSSPYRYPHINSGRNAHFMTINEKHDDGFRDFDREKEILRTGLDKITRKFERFDKIILSDESLWRVSCYSRRDVFPYIIEDSRKKGYEVQVIVYLRRQDDFIISLWNQRIKRNMPNNNIGCTMPFEERLEQMLQNESAIINYASKLDELADIFGKEHLIVRRFDPDSWVEHSIIHDFMYCIGLPVTEEFLPLETPANQGLLGNTTEIKRIINKEADFSTDEYTYLGNFLRELSPDSGRRYPCSVLSKEETIKLLAHFEEENQRVAQEYICDGKPLFSDEVKDTPKWQPDNPNMMEDVIRFYAAVTIDLRRQNQAMQQELQTIYQELSTIKENNETDKGTNHGFFSIFIVRVKNWMRRIRRRNCIDTSDGKGIRG
jgi:hypothetical protein